MKYKFNLYPIEIQAETLEEANDKFGEYEGFFEVKDVEEIE